MPLSTLNLNNLLSGESSQKMCLSTGELNFGTLNSGESKTLSLTVRSTGKKDLIITGLRTSNSAFKVSGKNCTLKALKPFEECSIQITFSPVSGGTYTGELTIQTSEGLIRSIKLYGESIPTSSDTSFNPNVPNRSKTSNGGGGGCNTETNSYFILFLLLLLKKVFKGKRA